MKKLDINLKREVKQEIIEDNNRVKYITKKQQQRK